MSYREQFKCEGCSGERQPGNVLCHACWTQLSPMTRTSLELRDPDNSLRVLKLFREIGRGTPLENIYINEGSS